MKGATDSTNEDVKKFIEEDNKDEDPLEELARQKHYLFTSPYIGYKINDHVDIYVTGGIRMVKTKYFKAKNKHKFHPTIGAGAHYIFKNGVFIKFEYSYVLQKKQRFYENDGGWILDMKIHHSENILKLGIGKKF